MILAGDNLPIIEGETIYSKGGGKYIVLEAKKADKIHLKFADNESGGAIFPAHLLVHIETIGAKRLTLTDEQISELKKILNIQ